MPIRQILAALVLPGEHLADGVGLDQLTYATRAGEKAHGARWKCDQLLAVDFLRQLFQALGQHAGFDEHVLALRGSLLRIGQMVVRRRRDHEGIDGGDVFIPQRRVGRDAVFGARLFRAILALVHANDIAGRNAIGEQVAHPALAHGSKTYN
ncbi:hypothetical protein D3C72_1456090 [compost metagenome]